MNTKGKHYMRRSLVGFYVVFMASSLFMQSGVSLPAFSSVAFYGDDSTYSTLLIPGIPEAFAQVPDNSNDKGVLVPYVSERGRHYERVFNGLTTNATGDIVAEYQERLGVPLWTLNPETGSHQPVYHKSWVGGMEEFSNGYIGIRAFGDYISFYDYTNQDERISNESWVLYKDGIPTVSTLTGTEFITNGTTLTYSLTYTNPNADYIFDYTLKEGELLDHSVKAENFNVKVQGDYSFQQEWDVVQFDAVNEERTTGNIKHDFTLPSITNGNAEIDTHKDFSITNNDNLIAYEKTGHDIDGVLKSNLISFELDAINDKIKYRWDLGTVNIGDSLSFNSGSTYTSANPTVDGEIRDNGNNDACDGDSGASRDDVSSANIVKNENTSSGIDCYALFFEYDLTSITDGSTVTVSEFKFETVDLVSAAQDCRYTGMETQPSDSPTQTALATSAMGDTTLTTGAACKTAGNNKSINLGAAGITYIEASLVRDWLSIGMRFDPEPDAGGEHTIRVGMEEGAYTPDPTLEITYNVPAPNYTYTFLDVYESSSTTLGSGTAMCQNVDQQSSGQSCNTDLIQERTYRFELTVTNTGTGAGSPDHMTWKNVHNNPTPDVFGVDDVANQLSSGCDTNTDWVPTVNTATALYDAGTTCSIPATSGSVVYWMVVTLPLTAGSGSAQPFLDDGVCCTDEGDYHTSFTVVPESCFPDAPTTPTAESLNSTQIDLAWTAPSNCTNSKVAVEQSADGSTGWADIYNSTVKTTHNATGLTGNDDFFYRISYQSDTGDWGNATSNVSDFTTPGAPTSNTATAISNTQINLTWVAPGGGGTLSYFIEEKIGAGGWTTRVADTGTPNVAYNATGLTAGTQYTYRISAINSDSTGVTSNEANDFTYPGTPTSLTAVATNSTSIDLTWVAPSGAVDGYLIEQKIGVGGWATLLADTGNTNVTYIVAGLTGGVQHTYRVTALNGADTGDTASNEANDFTYPGTPTTNSAIAVSNTQINLSWVAPSGAVDGYKIEEKIGAGGWSTRVTDTGNTNLAYNATALTVGTQYTYRLTSLNGTDTGTTSSNESSDFTFPGTPTSLTSITFNSTSIDLAWFAPSGVVDGYLIEQKIGVGGWATLVSDTNNTDIAYTVVGLTEGTQHTYRLTSLNGTDTGDNSSSEASTYTITGEPTGLMTIVQSTTAIDLIWTAPVPTGSGITGYKIERESPNDNGWSTLIANTTNTNIFYNNTGLTIDTQYNYRVSAHTFEGTSIPSTNSSDYTVIDPPTALRATTMSTSQINLSWTEPTQMSVTGYKIEERIDGGAWTTRVANTGTTSIEYNATGLSSNTDYDYRILTLNAGSGESVPSVMTSDTTIAIVPTPVIVSNTNSQLTLSWTSPTGASTILGYKIERESPIGGGWSIIVANTGNDTASYVNPTLSSNTQYNYRVSAINVGNVN